ncbi:hypothetical protein RRG08_057078 [Elysia crispata]|uniref:Uncharacterized protein n=1 Tax=Elysia crispata TaxID=231223 RepID=A0AAE1E141_9GAST|nr:hypothetical protein RRG08_057078 [Elysia crispata]
MLQDLSDHMTPCGRLAEPRGGAFVGEMDSLQRMLSEGGISDSKSGFAQHPGTLTTPMVSSSLPGCGAQPYTPGNMLSFNLVNEKNGNSSRGNQNYWFNSTNGETVTKRGEFSEPHLPHTLSDFASKNVSPSVITTSPPAPSNVSPSSGVVLGTVTLHQTQPRNANSCLNREMIGPGQYASISGQDAGIIPPASLVNSAGLTEDNRRPICHSSKDEIRTSNLACLNNDRGVIEGARKDERNKADFYELAVLADGDGNPLQIVSLVPGQPSSLWPPTPSENCPSSGSRLTRNISTLAPPLTSVCFNTENKTPFVQGPQTLDQTKQDGMHITGTSFSRISNVSCHNVSEIKNCQTNLASLNYSTTEDALNRGSPVNYTVIPEDASSDSRSIEEEEDMITEDDIRNNNDVISTATTPHLVANSISYSNTNNGNSNNNISCSTIMRELIMKNTLDTSEKKDFVPVHTALDLATGQLCVISIPKDMKISPNFTATSSAISLYSNSNTINSLSEDNRDIGVNNLYSSSNTINSLSEDNKDIGVYNIHSKNRVQGTLSQNIAPALANDTDKNITPVELGHFGKPLVAIPTTNANFVCLNANSKDSKQDGPLKLSLHSQSDTESCDSSFINRPDKEEVKEKQTVNRSTFYYSSAEGIVHDLGKSVATNTHPLPLVERQLSLDSALKNKSEKVRSRTWRFHNVTCDERQNENRRERSMEVDARNDPQPRPANQTFPSTIQCSISTTSPTSNLTFSLSSAKSSHSTSSSPILQSAALSTYIISRSVSESSDVDPKTEERIHSKSSHCDEQMSNKTLHSELYHAQSKCHHQHIRPSSFLGKHTSSVASTTASVKPSPCSESTSPSQLPGALSSSPMLSSFSSSAQSYTTPALLSSSSSLSSSSKSMSSSTSFMSQNVPSTLLSKDHKSWSPTSLPFHPTVAANITCPPLTVPTSCLSPGGHSRVLSSFSSQGNNASKTSFLASIVNWPQISESTSHGEDELPPISPSETISLSATSASPAAPAASTVLGRTPATPAPSGSPSTSSVGHTGTDSGRKLRTRCQRVTVLCRVHPIQNLLTRAECGHCVIPGSSAYPGLQP